MKKCLRLYLAFLLTPFCSSAQLQPATEYFSNLLKKNQALLEVTGTTPDNWRISDAYLDKRNNINYVYIQQTFKGIDIDKAITPLSFKNEKLVTGKLNFQKDIQTVTNQYKPAIDAKTALVNAAHSLNLDIKTSITALLSPLQYNTSVFDGLGISYNKIPVKLLWVHERENDESLILAWQVTISSFINNALWSINVDAITGKIINSTNLTVYEQSKTEIKKPHQILVFEDIGQTGASDNLKDIKSINSSKYNVIAYPNESPLTAGASLETNPWTQNHDQDANTLKWNSNDTTDFKFLRGNNVYVQQDLDSNNSNGGYSTPSSTNPPDLTFNYPINLAGGPIEDPDFGETNLFYWNNLMHDLSYQYGFAEAAGNFQNNNLGRGGKANDFVYADAQDGGGKGTHINNANFSTPADGSNPREQMYLWSPSFLKTFIANSPDKFKGGKPSREGNVSNQNRLALVGKKTAPVVIYKDALHPDSSNACGAPANASEISGKIAYIDRGSCNFTVKYHNAQQAGAIAIVVGNVAPDDPRYTNNSPGNALLTMSATPLDNSITIPGVFIQYDTAKKIKSLGSGNVNATLQPTPLLDGSLDNTIHTHEYTHGISSRLVGGPQNVNCLKNNEEMGEGWSDWYALMVTQNWANSSVTGDHIRAIGNYAIGLDSNSTGIRVYPYSTNFDYDPWTYDSLKALGGTILDPPDEHTVGEIWATMLWDMTWNLISKYGISQNIFDATGAGGNVIALHLVTEGMKLTNCSPGFVDARNGILDADTLLFDGKYSLDIWKAFAKRGLGYSAKQGTNTSTTDGTPAYDLPAVLPVTFGSFTAEKQGNSALLKWTTAQESNTNKFIVERSADGKPFVSIGEVKAAGNSSVRKSYQVTDASPIMGINLYHIKEVDNDGKFNLSDIRSLNFADISPSVTISPNPATNIVTIRIPDNNQNLTVRLLSTTGQLISTHAMSNELYTIDVSKLAAGVYNIVINGSDYSKKYKLVIQ